MMCARTGTGKVGCELARSMIGFQGVMRHFVKEQEHCRLCWTAEL